MRVQFNLFWLALGLMILAVPLAFVIYHSLHAESQDPLIDPSDEALVSRGRAVYAENCASCHGDALQGQPNWQQRLPNGRLPAPPHDESGHTWHHPDQLLIQLTKEGPAAMAGGGYKSDMPGFGEILSDEEIRASLSYIKSTWPAAIRERHDEINRAAQ